MVQPKDRRRGADGPIDFAFYRRRAARQRRLVQRAVAHHYLTLFVQMARSVIFRLTKDGTQRPWTAVLKSISKTERHR
jgi:hypothetical protein